MKKAKMAVTREAIKNFLNELSAGFFEVRQTRLITAGISNAKVKRTATSKNQDVRI
jgi:hypothetical protein